MTSKTAKAADLILWDQPDEFTKFSRPSMNVFDQWESFVRLDDVHCASCANTVRSALSVLNGVDSVDVNVGSRQARVVWRNQQTKPSVWLSALENVGFPARPLGQVQSIAGEKSASKAALWRAGIALLCMMQVMMYAWAEYVADPADLPADQIQLLRWAQLIISLPVLFFCCQPFFKGALRDLRDFRIGMDVPVAIGMLVSFAVSATGTLLPTGVFGSEVYFDSFTMFVSFLLIGRWLEQNLRANTTEAMISALDRLPENALKLLPDGSTVRIRTADLKLGDLICVGPGDMIQADGTIVQGRTTVDEALLTGESYPIPKEAGATVIAGSANLSGMIAVQIERLGLETRLGQIEQLVREVANSKPRLAQMADQVAKPFLVIVILLAITAAGWWWSESPAKALMAAVAVLVVTCPCALSLSVPMAGLATAGTLIKQGVLIRNFDSLERLAKVDTFLFDKTGTLTEDDYVLAQVVTFRINQFEAYAWAAQLAKNSLHPLSRAIVSAAELRLASSQLNGVFAPPVLEFVEWEEIAGRGIRAVYLDADAQPIELKLGSQKFCRGNELKGLGEVDSASIRAENSPRVKVFLADVTGVIATFSFDEKIRPDAKQTVNRLDQLDLQVRIVSGDLIANVQHLAAALGVKDSIAECHPEAKLSVIRHLQNEGRRVAMVGDGVNDSPVLAQADVSISFSNAAPIARASADLVLTGQRLAPIVQAVIQSRRMIRIMIQNLTWAFVYNLVCVPLAFIGLLPAWAAGLGMAFSSILVVANSWRLTRI